MPLPAPRGVTGTLRSRQMRSTAATCSVDSHEHRALGRIELGQRALVAAVVVEPLVAGPDDRVGAELALEDADDDDVMPDY